MELDTNIYKRLIEITGGKYIITKHCVGPNEDYVEVANPQSAIKDLITEFDVIEENYSDLRDKIIKKIDELKDHKFMIDMIDRWSDGDKNAWDRCVYQIKLLESIINDDREQE